MTSADYAVIYSDCRGTYQVQLFRAEDIPLARLNAKAEKFNTNQYGRKAVVVTDHDVVSAFCFFHSEQNNLRRRMKNFENVLYKLEDDIRSSSFVKLVTFDEVERGKK